MLKNRKTNLIILAAICFLFLSSASSVRSTSLQSNETSTQKYTWTANSFLEMFPKVKESKLQEYVQTLQDFGPHPTGSETLDDVGEYLYNELSSMDLTAIYDPWKFNEKSGKNIVATLPGESEGIVIVCAHYDTVSVSPGADDDGSGVASVLMIAEIMSNYSFNATVKFILFSGEEQGKLGSTEYARKAYENGDNIIGVLALDKVGYAVTTEDGNKIRHHSNKESEWMIDISEELSETYSKQIDLEVVRLPSDASSDHKAFINFGYDGSNLVEEALNPMYHTSEDNIEYINISYLTKVCKLALCILAKMACLDPTLVEDDLEIIIKGSYLSEISQLSIKVENKKHMEDTANVTITIEMKHIFRDIYVSTVKPYYKKPCSWNFTKEIDEYWEFKITKRVYTLGLIRLEVTIRGLDDDINLYKKEQTYGVIPHSLKILLIPKL